MQMDSSFEKPGDHTPSSSLDQSKTNFGDNISQYHMANNSLRTSISGTIPPPIIHKTTTFPTGEFDTIGGWLVIRTMRFGSNLTFQFLIFIREKPYSAYYILVCSIILLGWLSFLIWFIVNYQDIKSSTIWISSMILTGFCIFTITFNLVTAYYNFKNHAEPNKLSKIRVLCKFLYALLSLYCFVILAILDKNFVGLSFLFGALTFEIAHFLITLSYIFLAPFILLGLFIELTIRCFICDLSCGESIERQKKYEYGIFTALHFPVSELTACGLCNRHFNRNTKDLVIIACNPEHFFHERCIINYMMKRNDSCPVCASLINFRQK